MPTQQPLNSIRVPLEPPKESSSQGSSEEEGITLAHARNEVARDRCEEEEIADRQQARKQREEFAHKVFRLVVGWIIAVGALLCLSGWGVWDFQLSDSVLITLVGGTSASVIGLLAIVMRSLFPQTGLTPAKKPQIPAPKKR